jgi:hypothetical protein
MPKVSYLITGLFLSLPLWADPAPAASNGGPKIEVSSPDADKAALKQAAAEADQWAAAQKKAEPPPAPAPVPAAAAEPAAVTPPSSSTATPAAAPVVPSAPPAAPTPAAATMPGMKPTAAAKPYSPRPGLNQMQGKILSKSNDPQSLRILVDGGYNVEFTFDSATTIVNGGSPITMDDLNYDDVVIVRYSGKDLYAVELDRVSKAPRPQ